VVAQLILANAFFTGRSKQITKFLRTEWAVANATLVSVPDIHNRDRRAPVLGAILRLKRYVPMKLRQA
jgi:hypothetical protein